MTRIDIFSGFLGAGKTTLIKKLIAEAYAGQKLVLIENEFGEIAIDGGFLQEAGIQITEMSSGCICCSLVGDFREALKKVIDEYAPERILIEPSGVGKLSDVTAAVASVAAERPVQLNCFATVADVNKVKMYMKNFGEFYNDQIEHANAIVLSRTAGADAAKVAAAVELLREKNPQAVIVTTDWARLNGKQILAAMEEKQDFVAQLLAETKAHAKHEHHDHEEHEHHHEHHEHEHHHDEECTCGCHHDEEHDHGESCTCGHGHQDHEEHEAHHHEHDEACTCGHGHHEEHGEQEHHHHDHHDHEEACCCGHDHGHHEHEEHGEGCTCGCHDHGHEHHHHADEVFVSWGKETARVYTADEISKALAALDTGAYGTVLRAKGILPGQGEWIYFDYVPGEADVRVGAAQVIGKLCVIGAKLDQTALPGLFHLA